MTLGQFLNILNLQFTPGEKDFSPDCFVDIYNLSNFNDEPIVKNDFIDKDIAPAKNKTWYKTNKQKKIENIYFSVDPSGRGRLSIYIKD